MSAASATSTSAASTSACASASGSAPATLSWLGIVRLGLVQMALGSIVVLTTSTLNRIMVVELALAAALPGALVALHYGVQITRPNWGFRSDSGGRRSPWILGGVVALALGGVGASAATALMEIHLWAGIAAAALSFAAIGLGVGASGTSLLALLATATAPRRRAAAATITWLMMIAGIAITAGVVGAVLDPYSHKRLMIIVSIVCAGAVALTALAIRGVEASVARTCEPKGEPTPFREAFAEIWAEPKARRFSIFVFVSMTAYFMQELILEPYAGRVFGFTPGQSTSLAGLQNGGVFAGMVAVGILSTGLRLGSLRFWTVVGCLSSAAALAVIAALGAVGPGAPLGAAVVWLGASNGVFAVSAIGSMMQLAGEGRESREGTRMGLWGAAQAVAAGLGGLAGAAAVDLAGITLAAPDAYGLVFTAEALLFLVSARLALGLSPRRAATAPALFAGE